MQNGAACFLPCHFPLKPTPQKGGSLQTGRRATWISFPANQLPLLGVAAAGHGGPVRQVLSSPKVTQATQVLSPVRRRTETVAFFVWLVIHGEDVENMSLVCRWFLGKNGKRDTFGLVKGYMGNMREPHTRFRGPNGQPSPAEETQKPKALVVIATWPLRNGARNQPPPPRTLQTHGRIKSRSFWLLRPNETAQLPYFMRGAETMLAKTPHGVFRMKPDSATFVGLGARCFGPENRFVLRPHFLRLAKRNAHTLLASQHGLSQRKQPTRPEKATPLHASSSGSSS